MGGLCELHLTKLSNHYQKYTKINDLIILLHFIKNNILVGVLIADFLNSRLIFVRFLNNQYFSIDFINYNVNFLFKN